MKQSRLIATGLAQTLSIVALALLLSSCAAKQLFERQATTLAKANLSADDKFGVAVALPEVPANSMHQILVAPMAPRLADIAHKELGVNATPLDHSSTGNWQAAQSAARQATTSKKRRFFTRQKAPDYSSFFRQGAYDGYVLLLLEEITDGYSRNEIDYSIRGTLSVRELGRSEKGEPTETLLSRVALSPTVCSRRLIKQPKTDQMVISTEGYALSNPDRCLTLLGDKVQAELRALVDRAQ